MSPLLSSILLPLLSILLSFPLPHFPLHSFRLPNLLLTSGVSKTEEEEEADKWLNPYALANRGIFASYLSVGFGLYFILTPLTFYMVR